MKITTPSYLQENDENSDHAFFISEDLIRNLEKMILEPDDLNELRKEKFNIIPFEKIKNKCNSINDEYLDIMINFSKNRF